jgi:hypothetical protein
MAVVLNGHVTLHLKMGMPYYSKAHMMQRVKGDAYRTRKSQHQMQWQMERMRWREYPAELHRAFHMSISKKRITGLRERLHRLSYWTSFGVNDPDWSS